MIALLLALAAAPPAATTSAFAEEPVRPVTVYSGPPVITPNPPPPPLPRPSMITSPDWIRLPDGSDFDRFYPPAEKEGGVEGRAVVDCVVTTAGTLFNCAVVSESPANAGFGGATLRLMPFFKMRPMTKDGVSVGGAHVRVPVRWKLADDGPPLRPADLVPPGRINDYSTWLTARALAFASKAHHAPCTSAGAAWGQPAVPVTRVQLPPYMKPRPAKAYLERLYIGGCGPITMRVLVVWLDASGQWQTRDFPKGEALMPAPGPISIPPPPPLVINRNDSPPVPTMAPKAGSPAVSVPNWIRLPDGADMKRHYPPEALAHRIEGQVRLDCQVTSTGTLTDCRVAQEDPPGQGFGAATLALAPRFKMKAVTAEGAPVGGARVVIPLRWRLPED
jgi:TonB family protein